MVDLAIGAAVASLKAAGEIAGSFLKIHDAAIVQGKVIELQSIILAAQSSALAAQSEQVLLLEEKRQLEKHIANLEQWNREKVRYQLTAAGPGSFAYILKPEAASGEPIHAICSNCYQKGSKSIMQPTPRVHNGYVIFGCPACTAAQPINFRAFNPPEEPGSHER